MPKLIAKFWFDTGDWEFYSLTNPLAQEWVKEGQAYLLNIPQELLDRYDKAKEELRSIAEEIKDLAETEKTEYV